MLPNDRDWSIGLTACGQASNSSTPVTKRDLGLADDCKVDLDLATISAGDAESPWLDERLTTHNIFAFYHK